MARRYSSVLAAIIILAFSTTLCSQPNDIRLHGSNTVGELFAPQLIQAYLRKKDLPLIQEQPGESMVERHFIGQKMGESRQINIELHAHGSSTGFKMLLSGKTDIAMSSRPIHDSEIKILSKKYPSIASDDAEHVIAFDGLAVIVHQDVEINSMTVEDIASIFAGDITNWKEVGGKDLEIKLFARDDMSGTYDTFNNLTLKRFDKKLSTSAKRFESSYALKAAVESQIGSVGFVGISHVGESKVMEIAKVRGRRGFLPNKFTIGTEDYPLSRRLYMYLPTEIESKLAHDFIDFVESANGQQVAENVDLISYYPVTSTYRVASSSLVSKKFKNLAENGRRMSVVLRYHASSQMSKTHTNDENTQLNLDSKTKRDVGRILSYTNKNKGKKLFFVGFSSDESHGALGKAQVKYGIDWLANVLKGTAIKYWTLDAGYMPLSSNDSSFDKAMNQRIEVWVL
jgi:phosphate transport system substrate-binding protein